MGDVTERDRPAEAVRLEEIRRGIRWRRWGPYLSERQWGTVREDYSAYGTAWEYFPHDHARWGEDGIAGFADDQRCSASPSHYGTAAIRSSRSACSG
jgi:hypothetical protein